MLIIKTADMFHVFVFSSEGYKAAYARGQDLFKTMMSVLKHGELDPFTGILEVEDEGRTVYAREKGRRFTITNIVDSLEI